MELKKLKDPYVNRLFDAILLEIKKNVIVSLKYIIGVQSMAQVAGS